MQFETRITKIGDTDYTYDARDQADLDKFLASSAEEAEAMNRELESHQAQVNKDLAAVKPPEIKADEKLDLEAFAAYEEKLRTIRSNADADAEEIAAKHKVKAEKINDDFVKLMKSLGKRAEKALAEYEAERDAHLEKRRAAAEEGAKLHAENMRSRVATLRAAKLSDEAILALDPQFASVIQSEKEKKKDR